MGKTYHFKWDYSTQSIQPIRKMLVFLLVFLALFGSTVDAMRQSNSANKQSNSSSRHLKPKILTDSAKKNNGYSKIHQKKKQIFNNSIVGNEYDVSIDRPRRLQNIKNNSDDLQNSISFGEINVNSKQKIRNQNPNVGDSINFVIEEQKKKHCKSEINECLSPRLDSPL